LGLKMAGLTLTAVALLRAEAPDGWYKTGSQLDAYDIGTDTTKAHGGKGSGYIKSVAEVEDGKFGTAMQNIKADESLRQKRQTIRVYENFRSRTWRLVVAQNR
jgi:hypothetical protein